VHIQNVSMFFDEKISSYIWLPV